MIVPSTTAALGIIFEGLAVMGFSVGICTSAAVFAGILERKSTQEVNRWAQWGTAVGFALGVPLTICAFVLLQRSS
jgi:hypothetical protein